MLNNDGNTAQVIVQGGTTAILVAFLYDTIRAMIPYLVVAVIIIGVDLYFGILAAQKRKETVRFSRALRRTFNKLCEYFCWVMLSATLAVSFNAQWLQYVILGIVMCNEMTSVFSNYLASQGKHISGLNPLKIIGEKLDVDLDNVKVEPIQTCDKNGKGKRIHKNKHTVAR